MVKYQNFVEDANKKKSTLTQEIDELNTDIAMVLINHYVYLGLIFQCLEGQKLESERFKRELGDELRPTRTAKHNLDIAKQKHQAISSELDKYNELLTKVGEEVANKHKKVIKVFSLSFLNILNFQYLQYKQSLDELYEEFQPVIMDTVTKFCIRFERQHVCL